MQQIKKYNPQQKDDLVENNSTLRKYQEKDNVFCMEFFKKFWKKQWNVKTEIGSCRVLQKIKKN